MSPADWTYGEDGKAFEVQPGDTWTVGPHRFRNGSMMDAAVDDLADEVSLVYADPPWNQGNLSSFYTKARLAKPTEFKWIDIYRRILELAGSRPCFVEGGLHEEEAVRALVVQPHYRRWEITYYRRHSCVLHYCGPEPPPPGLNDYLPGRDDEHTPLLVMRAYGANRDLKRLVLDPCGGCGLTSRSADSAGWRSVSNELHPNRMSVALARLSRQINQVPKRQELADAAS